MLRQWLNPLKRDASQSLKTQSGTLMSSCPLQEEECSMGFVILPDEDYTPIKGGGSMGGWMSANLDEAKKAASVWKGYGIRLLISSSTLWA